MKSHFLRNYHIIYGTHRMTNGLQYGLKYGIIDTATGYNNAKLIKQTIHETDICPLIMTKFNPNDFEKSIENATIDHVAELGHIPSIVLLHSPFKTNEENLNAMCKLKVLFPSALVGISNFDLVQTAYLVDNNFIPDVAQLEYNPLFQPKKLLAYCQEKEIKIMAYRPFGKGIILKNYTIDNLATKLAIEPNHLILKWLQYKHIMPIVSSNNVENINSNMNFNDITLDTETIKILDNMDLGIPGSTCMARFSKVGLNDPIF